MPNATARGASHDATLTDDRVVQPLDFELIGSRGMPALLVGRSAARLVGTVRVVCLARVGRWTSAKECDGERGVGRRPPPSLRVLGLVGCWFFSHPRCPFHRTQKSRHRILGQFGRARGAIRESRTGTAFS